MTDIPGKNRLAFATRTIHGGQFPDPTTGAVMVPIYATSTYVQSSPGEHKGFEYSRSHNPTRFAFERCIADLESGTAGFAFASGLAAASTILEILDSGAHVIASDDLYGGSFRLFDKVRKRSAGLAFSFVDMGDMAAIEAAITPETKMIWVETPTNPMLRLADLGHRRPGQEARPDHRGRQHLRQPVRPAAAGVGLRHRHALGRPST
jgi:cystathionine gamma-lyase